MILVAVYMIIGLLLAPGAFNKIFGKEYQFYKEHNIPTDDNGVVVWMLMFTCLWPLFFIKYKKQLFD